MLRRALSRLRGEANLDDLIRLGMKAGRGVSIQPNCLIDRPHCWLISLGDNVTIAPRVIILAHDASTKKQLGYTRIAPVSVGSNCFIGAGALLLPGVNLEDDCIVAAGSVLPAGLYSSGSIYAGNPAKKIADTQEYFERKSGELKRSIAVFGDSYTLQRGIDEQAKQEMKERLQKARSGWVV